MTRNSINIDLLGKVPFFDQLSQDQLRQVAREAKEYGFSAGEVVRELDDQSDSYWILLYGSWKMERYVGSSSEPVIYETDKLGTWHGGIEIIDAIAPAKVVATSHSYILNVPASLMKKWVHDGFPILHHLLRGIEGGAKLLQTGL